MSVGVSMLRGVNVVGRNQIEMAALRALYQRLGLRNPQTYIQSGNVVFATDETKLKPLAERIKSAIEEKFGFRPTAVLRSAAEMRDTIARNPFAGRAGIEPNKLIVFFLAADLSEMAREAVLKFNAGPEELHIGDHELYIYFANGQGQSKLSLAALERATKTPFTGRNWNTVTKLMAMAESIEAGA